MWEARLGAPVVAPPVRALDTVIVGDVAGTVHCLGAAAGEPVRRAHHGEREEFFALCSDGAAVYAGGWSGRLHLLDAADGASLRSFDLGGQILATACSPGGRSVHAASSGGTCTHCPPRRRTAPRSGSRRYGARVSTVRGRRSPPCGGAGLHRAGA
ncbi:YncE family protein [Streptomyces sp. NPDC001212]